MFFAARELDHHECTMELSRTMEPGGERATGADEADSSGSGDPREVGKRGVEKLLVAIHPKSVAGGGSDGDHWWHHDYNASVL